MSARQTVLIVDDDTRTVELMQAILAGMGLEIFHAISGQDAIRLAHEIDPDVILMDLQLPAPSVHGVEAIKLIRGDALIAHIPVIVITAAGGEGIMRAMKAGANDYLDKPFSMTQLRNKISRILDAARR